MTIGELQELIKDIPKDFEFQIVVRKEREKSELDNSQYPYPFNFERCKTDKKDYDIAHCNNEFKIGVQIKEL